MANAKSEILPILEILFAMPAPGPAVGSAQWLASMKANPNLVTFAQMVDHPELLRQHVQLQVAEGDDNGYVKLQPGEQVKDVNEVFNYDGMVLKDILPSTKRSVGYHINWRFLRSGAVFYAVEKMKTLGLIPMKMKPSTMPEVVRGCPWNNFAKLHHYFHVFYCHAQAIERTQELARQVLVYLFHGEGWFKKATASFIPILHKKLQNGLHRLTVYERIQKHWGPFIKDLAKNPKWMSYLDDKGVAQVPHCYLCSVEKCLRDLATDVCTMGAHAMNTKTEWQHVPIWRKREAYIAMVRHVKELPGYQKYISFDWNDYQMRNRCQKTFEKRHAPYTDGTDELKNLKDHPRWAIVKNRTRPSVQRRQKTKARVQEQVAASASASASASEYRWDSEDEEWVKI